MSRRLFLGASLTTLALGASRRGLANPDEAGKRFLFINAEGGWDPLCVFAPLFGGGAIEMEPDAERWTLGNFSLVDHPLRPQTRAFLEKRQAEMTLLHGVSTRSVNHETCQCVSLTGSTSDSRPDFPTLIAQAERDRVPLPHLVMSGPAFPGPFSVFVSRAEGQLQGVIDGGILDESDFPLDVAPLEAAGAVDDVLVARGRALAIRYGGESSRVENYQEALVRAHQLNNDRDQIMLASSESMLERARTGIEALSAGLTRCVSLATDTDWDTHQDNSIQTPNFELFFSDLDAILTLLETTRGPHGRPLREDTVVVVTSEMARTPAFNATGGRDHWPYTTFMLFGPGVATGRSFGGYTDLFTGIGVASDGALDRAVPGISTESLGASLLTLGGVDPEPLMRGASVIPGLLT